MVVICPLLSLVSDQVNSCKEKNISAKAWNSTVSEKKKKDIVSDLLGDKDPDFKLLFITPESLFGFDNTLRNALRVSQNTHVCLGDIYRCQSDRTQKQYIDIYCHSILPCLTSLCIFDSKLAVPNGSVSFFMTSSLANSWIGILFCGF